VPRIGIYKAARYFPGGPFIFLEVFLMAEQLRNPCRTGDYYGQEQQLRKYLRKYIRQKPWRQYSGQIFGEKYLD
jgi:hypothetical protein